MSRLLLATDLAVLHHELVGAAEEMGEALKRSAFSPNIKERQDYSCALFDAQGRLLAQAAHLPVHLGSMPASVEAIIRSAGKLTRESYWLVNDPYHGGTHLPDLTMVAPVYAGGSDRLLGYAANRAHHADIGGAAAGSMAPQTDLMAEGLIIPPTQIAEAGTVGPLWSLILANTRTPVEREGDLRAQIASCDRGIARLIEIEKRFGPRRFQALTDSLFEHSRAMMRAGLMKHLRRGTYLAEDVLDDDGAGTIDIPIRLKLKVTRERLTFDFTGSSAQVAGAVNAVRAVTVSACFYAALCFCDAVVPVNHGCFGMLEVIAPLGSIVNARRPSAVAAGNVETSQRIVDVCLAALGSAAPEIAPAQSQGTMNNLTIGGDGPGGAFTYYETIAGGCGGAPGRLGASATHSHMTNTLNTPIEALEHAYPLRIDEYSLRVGSGGSGGARGGEGVLRRVRVLVPAEFALLTERRAHSPQGIAGGGPGKRGENRKVAVKGKRTKLPGKCAGSLGPGESIEIRTPGGGGHGRR